MKDENDQDIEEVTFEKAVAQAHQKPWPFVPLTIVWITVGPHTLSTHSLIVL